jgi:hypothetical protein
LRKSLRVVMSVSSLGESLRNGPACPRAARLCPAIECRRGDFIKRPAGIPDAPCVGLGDFDLSAAPLRLGEGGSAQRLG